MRHFAILLIGRSRLKNDHVLNLILTAFQDEDTSVREAAQRIADRFQW